MCLSTRPTSKWFFVPRLPNGSLEIAKVGSPEITKVGSLEIAKVKSLATLGPNYFVRRPPIEIKQNFTPCRKLSNDMLHAIYTQGNWVDSRLLVVRSQTANLIPDPSFGHNLCFRSSNGSCKPILDI